MKLKLACKLGKQMGMITIGEAVDNIEHHAISLFKYEDIVNELDEMYNDLLWEELDLTRKDKIESVIPDER